MKIKTNLKSLALFTSAAALWQAGARADINAAAQLALGNPSAAVADARYETNYLISRPQYALAYSRYDGITKWVSWHLNASDVGSAGRQDTYRPDTNLPSGWYETPGNPSWSTVAAPYGSYDRGHMCPSADRTDTVADNDQLFWMTNLVPQASDNNQGPWEVLESYTRTQVQAGNEAYIISGPRGYATAGPSTDRYRITSGHVTAPAYVWKVIVILPNSSADDVSRVTAATRVIAVDMPNINGIRSVDWKTYRVSVARIEAETGLNFFSNVPVAIANALKAKVDNG